MKITYVCPGTGGAFYCENCVRDHAFITGLRALGHEVDPVAMYLPVEETDASGGRAPVTFGAVRLYLTDKYPFLKKAPDPLLRLLDSRPVLNMAAGFAGSTRAGGHEEMTISMIMGEEGPFSDEFDAATRGMLAQKPDAVILPNAFMLGVASAVKAKSPSAIVICLLQDEHVWTDLFAPEFRGRAWEVIAKKSRFADKLYTHSDWYRRKVAPLIDTPLDEIATIPFGVDPGRFARSSASSSAQISIGYLSRLCGDLGMDILAKAYCLLLKSGVCGAESALDLCGGYTKDDAAVVNSSRKSVTGANGRVNIRKRFDVGARSGFLSTLTVLSVPSRTAIAFGGFISEAMAAGVPVVQPDDGGFTEAITETDAGLLYSPNSPEALADALEKVIRDKEARGSMAEAGIRAVAEKYNNVEMARRAIAFL